MVEGKLTNAIQQIQKRQKDIQDHKRYIKNKNQHKLHQQLGLMSGAPEELADPDPLVISVMLLVVNRMWC